MNKIEIITSLIQVQGKIRNKIITEMKEFCLDDESITPLQIEALMTILEYKQIKMSDLAKILNLKTSGATQLINSLVLQNKVERLALDNDRRVTLISLTPQYTVIMKKMKTHHNKTLVSIFDKLDQSDLQTLLQITNKLSLAL